MIGLRSKPLNGVISGAAMMAKSSPRFCVLSTPAGAAHGVPLHCLVSVPTRASSTWTYVNTTFTFGVIWLTRFTPAKSPVAYVASL